MIRKITGPATTTTDGAKQRIDVSSSVNTSSDGMAIPKHDYISYGYTGSNITTITYKTGGASGTVVATVTLTYTDGNPTSKTITL